MFILQHAFSISGKITDQNGNPLQGISVWLDSSDNIQTDLNGNYGFFELLEGTYNIRPTKDGYRFMPEDITIDVPPDSSETNFTGYDCLSTNDTDGDGLVDGWEFCGYDDDGDDFIDVDLPRMGADYQHKDIFVEIDYMGIGPGETKSHQPNPEAIRTIVNSFNNAPVNNPDETTGIHLHVDYGDTAPLSWGDGDVWGDLSRADELEHQEYLGWCADVIFSWSSFDNLKEFHFEGARHEIFHYNIWTHELCWSLAVLGTTGLSRNNPASDFIVSLGGLDTNPGTLYQQAGTFMHELGHNLGLMHGGDDNTKYKPNYLSVMNYSFQTRGLVTIDPLRKFDYSRDELPLLYELSLNEPDGIGLPASENYGTRWWCSLTRMVETQNARAVDWNCDHDNMDLGVFANINREIQVNLHGHDDWSNLVYDGGAVGGLGVGEELPEETEVDELTEEEDKLIPSITYVFLPSINR